jgi:hypothetical protein
MFESFFVGWHIARMFFYLMVVNTLVCVVIRYVLMSLKNAS